MNSVEFNQVEKKVLVLRRGIVHYFAERGFKVRVIYRASSLNSGEDAPPNLLPTRRKKDRITIFLDFQKNEGIAYTPQRVVAFLEQDAERLPILSYSYGVNIVDMDRLDEKYIFNDIQDLKENYARILGE